MAQIRTRGVHLLAFSSKTRLTLWSPAKSVAKLPSDRRTWGCPAKKSGDECRNRWMRSDSRTGLSIRLVRCPVVSPSAWHSPVSSHSGPG